MAYELYKEIKNKEDYFNSWKPESLETINDLLKETLYQRYVVKCKVFQRDNFRCQNEDCTFNSDLTIHHIKARRNGGEDKERNCITLCVTCHQGYEKAKRAIRFGNKLTLPAHIRGRTFKLHTPDNTINWKKVKSEMKILRKNLREHCGMRLSSSQIIILMKFLEIDFSSEDD